MVEIDIRSPRRRDLPLNNPQDTDDCRACWMKFFAGVSFEVGRQPRDA